MGPNMFGDLHTGAPRCARSAIDQNGFSRTQLPLVNQEVVGRRATKRDGSSNLMAQVCRLMAQLSICSHLDVYGMCIKISTGKTNHGVTQFEAFDTHTN